MSHGHVAEIYVQYTSNKIKGNYFNSFTNQSNLFFNNFAESKQIILALSPSHLEGFMPALS